MATFNLNCPHCSRTLSCPEEARGHSVDCPVCRGKIAVPLDPAVSTPPVSSASPLHQDAAQTERKVGFWLGAGILFMPYIFCWLTLRKGYSTSARVVSFAWLILLVVIVQEPASSNLSTTTISAMGVNYDQVVNDLDVAPNMESVPINGRERHIGMTADKMCIIEVIGSKNNTLKTSIVVEMPNDNNEKVRLNTARVITFLRNVLPEWDNKNMCDWYCNALAKSRESTVTIGNKKITLHALSETGMIDISVSPIDK